MSTEAAAPQTPSIVLENGTESSRYLDADESGQNGNLEKIRDILFGQQARDHERRFIALEQNLAKEAGALQAELTKRFDALEAYMQQEIAMLSDRLRHEQQVRGEALQQLGTDLTGLGAIVERKATDLTQQTTQTEHKLREEALAYVQELKEDLRSTELELTESVNRSVTDLQHTKTDRTALAALFGELSRQLQQTAQRP